MLCGNIGPWPDHCGTRRKEGRALRVSFVAEDVFHGFIAVAPVKIHSGPLQPRPEWGGMLEPGGAGLRAERSVRPRLFRAPAGRHQTSDDWRSLARVEYEAGDRIVPSRRPGAGASRLRSAAAALLERRAVITAIAVTRARRLIAPRSTPHAGDRGHRGDLGLADACHAAGPFGTPLYPPFNTVRHEFCARGLA